MNGRIHTKEENHKTENNKRQQLIYDLKKDTCKASKQKIDNGDATKINV